jgi:hypothetical protein
MNSGKLCNLGEWMKLTQLVLIIGLVFTTASCGSGENDFIDPTPGNDGSAVDAATMDARTAESATADAPTADFAIADTPIRDSVRIDASADAFPASDTRTADSAVADAWTNDALTADSPVIDSSMTDMRTADSVSTDGPDAADMRDSNGASGDTIDGDAGSHVVSVALAGTGLGVVTSNPAGINCGTTCDARYASGTLVTLDATSSLGSIFSGWSGGGCSGTAPCQIAVNDATTVTATFTLDQYSLTVNPAGSGAGTVTSNPAGINCGTSCVASFDHGQTVTLTALSHINSTFTGWSGSGCAGTAPCTVSMTAARTVTATFALDQYRLTVSKAGNGAGTVTSNPAGINCGTTCFANFNYGQDVTLTASPSSGSTFTGWSGSGCTGTTPCTVSVTALSTVSATFTLLERTLSVGKAGTGMGTVVSNPAGIDCGTTCSAVYNHGTVVSVYANSSTSAFMGWSGSCVGTGPCSITMISSRSVTATFVPPLSCTTVSTAFNCTNGPIAQINLGPLASPACHDQCQIAMRQAGMATGCWIFATDGSCYCRSGSLSGGGSRPGGSCN